jgi:DNA-binding PadR family transcriptional regulator
MLGLLGKGPASGYDLMKRFEISLANVWPATQSQVYGELNRLAETGLIEVVAEGPRGRKEYAITEAGGQELRHWLTEVEPLRQRRSDMLLRVFFLDAVEPVEAREYLERQAALAMKIHDYLCDLKENVATGESALSVYGRLALEWGLRFSAMERDWAEWAADQIADRADADRSDADRSAHRVEEIG